MRGAEPSRSSHRSGPLRSNTFRVRIITHARTKRPEGETVMWQPFTEDHAQFRKTVRQFAEKELAPHAEEWEADEMFPNWVFKRAGDLGLLNAHYPEEHGGAGLDYWFSVAKAEELVHSRLAGVNMGLLVQSDMATPVISDIGT